MAKRFTDTDLWDKEWYMKLNLKQKCLLKLVRDKCDLCGVWSPNWIIACAYIGESVNERDLLEIDGGKQFKKIPSGKIYCIGFIEFQYGNLSDRSPVHKKIIGLLEQNGLLDNYKETPIKYPIDRVQEEEEDKEEEKVKEKEDFSIINETETNQAFEFLQRIGKKEFDKPDIINLWNAFVIHKQDFIKESRSRQMQHFRDWLKFQKKQDGVSKLSGEKLGTSAARVAALKALK